KCTWASMIPGRMCRPLASITSVPSGRESSMPMATNFSPAMATPPLNVSSGVTTQPFLITRSAFMPVSRGIVVPVGCAPGSVGIEHGLDFVGVAGLGQRQREQDARLPGRQVVAGNKAALGEARASRDPARGNAAAKADEHALFPTGLVESGIFRRRRPPGPGAGADDAFGARVGDRFDHRAIRSHIGEND